MHYFFSPIPLFLTHFPSFCQPLPLHYSFLITFSNPVPPLHLFILFSYFFLTSSCFIIIAYLFFFKEVPSISNQTHAELITCQIRSVINANDLNSHYITPSLLSLLNLIFKESLSLIETWSYFRPVEIIHFILSPSLSCSFSLSFWVASKYAYFYSIVYSAKFEKTANVGNEVFYRTSLLHFMFML